MSHHKLLLLDIIIAVTISSCTENHTASSPSGEFVRTLVAAHAMTELGTWGDITTLSPSSVRIEEVPSMANGLVVSRAWINRSHWHPYTIAIAKDRVLLLGGFENPELIEVSKLMKPDTINAPNLLSISRMLARLGDPGGGVEYAFIGDDSHTVSDSVISNLLRAQQQGWPADTAVGLSDGQWQVVLTLVTRETRSYTQHWTPIAFAFRFDRDGQLKAWSRRVGTSFGNLRRIDAR